MSKQFLIHAVVEMSLSVTAENQDAAIKAVADVSDGRSVIHTRTQALEGRANVVKIVSASELQWWTVSSITTDTNVALVRNYRAVSAQDARATFSASYPRTMIAGVFPGKFDPVG